jgi:hypothetical protein
MSSKEIGTKRIADAVSGEKSVITVSVVDGEIVLALAQDTKGDLDIRLKSADIMMLIKWLEKAAIVAKFGV